VTETAIEARRAFLSLRRSFIGGSDARIIMGTNEAALIRLWQEKRGEIEPARTDGHRGAGN
jgi:predicted phage-related endonuclease